LKTETFPILEYIDWLSVPMKDVFYI
jgi:hypothetical protein